MLKHEELEGVINCAAPEAIKNHELMRSIRKAYGMPFGLPTPTFLLELGAKINGTEIELILKSKWVSPTILLNSGFNFQYGKIDEAVHDILSLRI